jgi:hypothetical protein
MDQDLSQDHTSATSVAGNVWERNGVALQLKSTVLTIPKLKETKTHANVFSHSLSRLFISAMKSR